MVKKEIPLEYVTHEKITRAVKVSFDIGAAVLRGVKGTVIGVAQAVDVRGAIVGAVNAIDNYAADTLEEREFADARNAASNQGIPHDYQADVRVPASVISSGGDR